jgi:TonB family protein
MIQTMRWIFVLLLPFVLASGQETADLVMPGVVGQPLYPASRMLRRMGLEVRFEQVAADSSAGIGEFCVAGQVPDSGVALDDGQEVVLQFNCPQMLRYWDEWVVPFLGDLDNTRGYYSVSKPPEPVRLLAAGYPAGLKQFSFSGDAQIEALVDFDGSVLAARVMESSGYEEADSSALHAALRGSFSPAEHYEQPVRVWFPMPYHWEFEEAPDRPDAGTASDPGLDP